MSLARTHTIDEAWEIIEENVGSLDYTSQNKSRMLHLWIGEKHIHETGRSVGSGSAVPYTDKDIRRAVAHLRLQALIGKVVGKRAQAVTRRVREVASYQQGGWVVVTGTDEEPIIRHFETGRDVSMLVLTGEAFVVIPCIVAAL